MTEPSRASTLLFVLGAVASCDLLGTKSAGAPADASVEPARVTDLLDVPDSAPPPAVGPTAANEDDVARFPDEVRTESPATIQRPTNVREVPLVGGLVASLARGTPVTQISHRERSVLVTFDAPKAAGTKLMGWVTADAFVALSTVDAGVRPLTCAAPDVALSSDSPFCGRPCKADGECPPGQACKGTASTLRGGKAGDPVTVCATVVTHDAGAPAVAGDGGAGTGAPVGRPTGLPVLEAGAPSAAADGGAPSPAEADVVSSRGMACPAGYHHVAKNGRCHRLCSSGAECKHPASGQCVGCGEGIRVCAASSDVCK